MARKKIRLLLQEATTIMTMIPARMSTDLIKPTTVREVTVFIVWEHNTTADENQVTTGVQYIQT